MSVCSIYGLGYIGLPLSAILADNGHKVIGVDVNLEIIDKINQRDVHINEPDLKALVDKVVKNKKLTATISPSKADVFVIAVPTPFHLKANKERIPDINYVISAAKSIASVIKKNNLIIIESTCPVGTTEKIRDLINKISGLSIDDFFISYCPERVLPGNILKELVTNSRVIGGINKESSNLSETFYSSFCKGKLLITNSRTAELVKLTENSYRDTNIAFANELSMICSEANIDVHELINLSNHHPRVNILNPGCGVGGHCIAVDPWFIISEFPKYSKLLKSSREVNINKTEWSIKKIIERSLILEKKLGRKPIVGCLGLTFKPNVDDTRESPALTITNRLIQENIKVIVCEPNLTTFGSFNLLPLEKVLEEADLIIFLVAHDSFKNLNPNLISQEVIDFCGLQQKLNEKGI